MHPHDLLVKKFLTLCHVDAYLGIGDVPILCPFLEFLLLGSCVALWAGPCRSQSLVSGLFVTIVIAQAISQSCANYGLCHIVFPCFWAITRSHMLNTCSRDLGVLRDLKSNLGNTRVTYTKNFIGKLMFLIFHWTRS